jgi:hypothetical protein
VGRRRRRCSPVHRRGGQLGQVLTTRYGTQASAVAQQR